MLALLVLALALALPPALALGLAARENPPAAPFGPYPGPRWMHPRLHYAPLNTSAGDISGALSHNGVHHVWQLCSLGWHHRVSSDLVRWRAASASEPVGPSNWPSASTHAICGCVRSTRLI
jgi:hypothetical protein